MPAYRLGNGDDTFDSTSVADWTNGSSVFGGNGDDAITARYSRFGGSGAVLVRGGNGDDTILIESANGLALGGNGDDTLEATSRRGNAIPGGLGNTLRGGNGDDLLISNVGGSTSRSPGNTLTGGFGQDSFQLSSGFGNLLVVDDAGGDGVVSEGDMFRGPLDVITDYEPGERLTLRNYDGTEDLPAAEAQEVAVVPDPFPASDGRFRPVVGDGEYATFQGTLNEGNLFTVDAGGHDLFIVYDPLDGDDTDLAHGSVVLLGVQEEQITADLFAPPTAAGVTGQEGYGGQAFGADGGEQGSMSLAALDPASSALDLIAT